MEYITTLCSIITIAILIIWIIQDNSNKKIALIKIIAILCLSISVFIQGKQWQRYKDTSIRFYSYHYIKNYEIINNDTILIDSIPTQGMNGITYYRNDK